LVNYALSDVTHLPQLMKEQNAWLERLGLTEEFSRQMDRVFRSESESANGATPTS
jgi:hypothetical protein